MKSLNSGYQRVLKNVSVIKRCPLLGGSLTEIVTFRSKHFVRYIRHVCYLECPLLRGFTVVSTKTEKVSRRLTIHIPLTLMF